MVFPLPSYEKSTWKIMLQIQQNISKTNWKLIFLVMSNRGYFCQSEIS